MKDTPNIEKSKIIAFLLEQKEASYRNMMHSQRADMDEAEEANDAHESLFEGGKVDQSMHRVEARSSAVSALKQEIDLLNGLDSVEANENIQLGDVIFTDRGVFFVAVPEEAFTIDGVSMRGISTESPLFRALAGKSNGDVVEVNGTKFTLIDSY